MNGSWFLTRATGATEGDRCRHAHHAGRKRVRKAKEIGAQPPKVGSGAAVEVDTTGAKHSDESSWRFQAFSSQRREVGTKTLQRCVPKIIAMRATMTVLAAEVRSCRSLRDTLICAGSPCCPSRHFWSRSPHRWRVYSSRRPTAVRVSVPSADVNLGCIDSHGRARRRGPAEFILDGAQTDSLVCVPDAAIDIGYARALVTRPEALGTGDSNPEVLRPYTRLSALRLRASSSRAAGHLLRSSLLPSLELLTLYSHYDDNGGGEEEKGQRLAESSAPEPSTSAAMGGSVGAADVPPDFLAFQGLRELTIDEGGTRHGSGWPWGEWAAFRHLSALESLTWIGGWSSAPVWCGGVIIGGALLGCWAQCLHLST